MRNKDYNRSVSLLCSTCGSGDFRRDGDQGPVTCVSCERVFTREELIRENGAVIDAEVNQMKSEIFKDAKREFNDAMRKAFRGSKYFKFK